MAETAGRMLKFTTLAAIWRGHFGKHSGCRPRRVITCSSFVPATAKATCRNGKRIAVHSLAPLGFITSVCTSRREGHALRLGTKEFFFGGQQAMRLFFLPWRNEG